jgi:hypothetical protein
VVQEEPASVARRRDKTEKVTADSVLAVVALTCLKVEDIK